MARVGEGGGEASEGDSAPGVVVTPPAPPPPLGAEPTAVWKWIAGGMLGRGCMGGEP